jgi:hypothetical protein
VFEVFPTVLASLMDVCMQLFIVGTVAPEFENIFDQDAALGNCARCFFIW